MPTTAIPFIDLAAQRARLSERLQAALAAVHSHGRYVLGPEVQRLEGELAALAGVRYAVTCGNGTDALELALEALGGVRGRAVVVPAFTFCAPAEVVVRLGGVPVFADVDSGTFHVTPGTIAQACEAARAAGLEVAGAIAVDLFGQPADADALAEAIAPGFLVADAAQSFGARYGERPVGSLAPVTTTSFYPSKPLGCYGDGGALFTDEEALADRVRSLRMHGQGSAPYEHERVGRNSRLDTLQAAVLLVKLDVFAEELEHRRRAAARYTEALAGTARTPVLGPARTSTWAQYTVLVEQGDRDRVRAALAAAGIPTAVHYPRPLHRQPAYRDYPIAAGGLPVSEYLAERVLSLPMHAYLQADVQDRIIDALRSALAGA